MKDLAIALFILGMLCTLPVTARPALSALKGEIIELLPGGPDNPDWGEDERSSFTLPLVATYESQAVYFYAYEEMRDVAIMVTDSQGCEVASAIITVFPGQSVVLALNTGSGNYRLNVEYKGSCYYGYFEM